MAQYYTDFSEYTVGAKPNDWTLRFGVNANDFTVETLAGGEGGKMLRYNAPGGFGGTTLTWDQVGSVADVEVLVKARASDSSNSSTNFIVTRFDAPSDFELFLRLRSTALRVIDDGTQLSSITIGADELNFRWFRFRVIGNDVKAKYWAAGSAEPATWNTEFTAALKSLSGAVGTGVSIQNYFSEIDVFSVGTNGDSAPIAPVGGGDDLLADDIQSASEVTAPTIGQTHALTSSDVESESSTETVTLGQVHALTFTDVESASQLSVPTLTEQNNTVNLSANDVQSVSEVTQPAISQVHNLAANDAESVSEVTPASIGQEHALTSVDISSLSEVTQPSLTEVVGVDALSANDVESSSEVTTATIAQIHVLQSDGVESASQTQSATITQIHALTAIDTESSSQVSSPVIRNPDQALAQPVNNTRSTVSQVQYKAASVTPVYNADIIQTNYKVEVA